MSTAYAIQQSVQQPPLSICRHSCVVRIFAIVFLTLALAITFSSRERIFGTAYYEEGDDAANALQIARAKQFNELHGNYSRWNFHHPGPAFFYVYAAGEWLLHDVTGIAPAPRNAHLFAGMLLQLAFYAAAIALLAGHSRQPLLTTALALVAGGLHYAQVERAIYGVWPPDVLVMPFLCFTVACAAVAAGHRTGLPVLVVSGSFLVHGHVAQPLFVVPMAALAICFGLRRHWGGGMRELIRHPAGITGAVLLALFLLPLVLDLLAGRWSNAHDIYLHLRYGTTEGQSLWQSFLCYASYFVGLSDPTPFNELTPDAYTPFRERAWLLVFWAAVLAFVLRRTRRSADTKENATEHHFARQLLVFWGTASALTLVWGIRQDGGFTTFNSHFNHSLVHVLALAGVLLLVSLLPKCSRAIGWFALVGSVPAFAFNLPFDTEVGSRGDEVASRLLGLLLADPNPAAPKLITWDTPERDWYEAVTLGRAFQRLGIEFYVHPSYRIMFGSDKVFTNEGDVLSRGEISVWHVLQREKAPPGAHILSRESAVVFPAIAPIPKWPLEIDFSRNDHQRLSTFGIGTAEETWSWTEGHVAALLFQAPASTVDLELTLEATGHITRATARRQRVEVRVNGQPVGRATFTESRDTVRIVVPNEVWNRSTPRVILFDLPDAISPSVAGRSGDSRVLGLALHRLSLKPLAP